jgi:hypothetical protein
MILFCSISSSVFNGSVEGDIEGNADDADWFEFTKVPSFTIQNKV